MERVEHTSGNQGNDEGIKELVKGLTAIPTPDAAAKTFELGQGTWEVQFLTACQWRLHLEFGNANGRLHVSSR